MNHLSYILRNTASAAFCVLTLCFNSMNVGGDHRTLPYNLFTSTVNVVTTVVMTCVFFKWSSGGAGEVPGWGAAGCSGLRCEGRRGTWVNAAQRWPLSRDHYQRMQRGNQ